MHSTFSVRSSTGRNWLKYIYKCLHVQSPTQYVVILEMKGTEWGTTSLEWRTREPVALLAPHNRSRPAPEPQLELDGGKEVGCAERMDRTR